MLPKSVFILLVGCISFMGIISCKKSNYTYQYQKPATIENLSSKILFLIFSATDSSNVVAKVKLKEKKMVDGQFKDVTATNQSPNRLEIKFLDSNQSNFYSTIIDHPLLRSVEYTYSSNQLNTKTAELKEAEFFVRANVPANAVLVKIIEFRNNKEAGFTLININ
jgi:hypothetical protein